MVASNKQRKRGISRIFFFIGVGSMILWLSLVRSVNAASPTGGPQPTTMPSVGLTKECEPLDLVLLIDQSDSMRYNDPENFRIIVVRHLLQILMTDLVTTCPHTNYRVAVVEFGDEAVTTLGPINLAQLRAEDLHTSLEKLDNLFDSHGLGRTNEPHYMGRTNHGAAFLEAAQDLKIMEEGRKEQAQRAVLLLTDGWPCVESWGCSLQHDTMDRKAYMEYLRSDIIPQLPSGTRIWTVALNDKTSYLDLIGDDFRKIGELDALRYNRAFIATEMHKVFQEITGRREEIVGEGEPLPVPPYLGMMTLYIYKEANVSSEIQLPGGYRLQEGHSIGDADAVAYSGLIYYHADKSGASEVYSFFAPPGGIWRVINAAGKHEAYEVKIQAVGEERGLFGLTVYASDGKRVLNSEHWPQCVVCDEHGSDTSNPFQPSVHIQVALNKGNGETVKINLAQWRKAPAQTEECALHLQAIVVAPDGTETTIPLRADKNDLTLWHFTQPLPVSQLATPQQPYRVYFEGRGPVVDEKGACEFQEDVKSQQGNEEGRNTKGWEQVLKRTEVFSYTTGEVSVVKMAMTSPEPDEVVRVWQAVSPFKLVQAPVDITLQVEDEKGEIIAPEEVFPDGGVSAQVTSREGTQNLVLERIPEGYRAHLVFEHARNDEVCVTVRVADDKYNRQMYYFRQEDLEQRFCFRRGGFLYPIVFYGKWVLILALLALAVMYWGFVLQPFGGQLEIRSLGGGEPEIIDLNIGRLRLFPHVTKRLSGTGLPVKKITVRHSGSDHIQVEVVSESGNKEVCILAPGEAEYLDEVQVKWLASGLSFESSGPNASFYDEW